MRRADERPAAAARAAGAAVDPEAIAGRARIWATGVGAGGGDAGWAPAAGVRNQEPAAGLEEPVQGGIVNVGDPDDRVDALEPQDLALVDVADPGDRALVGDRLRDRALGPRRGPQPAPGLREVNVGSQEVGAEAAEGRMEVLSALFEELDDGHIERDGDRARDLEDERRAAGRAAPRLAGPVAMPRLAQAEMGWTSRPLSKRMSRFLPSESTSVTVAPTTFEIAGPGTRARAALTQRPRRCGRRPSAVRASESPSGIGQRRWAGRRTSPR